MEKIIRGRSIDGTMFLQLHGAVIGWSSRINDATRFRDETTADWWLLHVRSKQQHRDPDEVIGRLCVIDAPRRPSRIRTWWEEVKEYAYWDQEQAAGWCDPDHGPGLSPQPTYLGSILKGLWFVTIAPVRYHLASLVCRWRGHDIEDEGYANGDSGCDAGTCRRCGWSYHVTMY